MRRSAVRGRLLASDSMHMGTPSQVGRFAQRFQAVQGRSAAPLPSLDEYAAALLDPVSCFDDPELKASVAVLDRRGRPVAAAGSFGSVFRLSDPQGRSLAVKCFTRYAEHPGLLQRRHALVSAVLKRLGHRWKVEFEFLSKGVLVERQWYPVLKMEWVQGQDLGSFIDRNLHRPGSVATVAMHFASLAADLAANGLAHGDLQPGNLLVERNRELRLIDYGGMYAPGLEYLEVAEKGHEHYQSPDREGQFGPDLDRFSTWVIYGSLAALTIDPTLWVRLRAGRQDQLLFNRSDFCDPAASPALEALITSGNGALRALGETLRDMWARGLAAVPILDPSALPA